MGETVDKTALHKKAILQVLKETLGNVTRACEAVGVGRSTFYSWTREKSEAYDKEFAEAVSDITEGVIDHVEDKLHELVDGVTVEKELKTGELRVYQRPPDTAAVCFFLKCRAKKRGYIERQDIGFDKDTLESLAAFLSK